MPSSTSSAIHAMVCHIPMPPCAHRCCGLFSTGRAERKTMGRLLAGIAPMAMGLAIGLYAAPELIAKLTAAVDAGAPPDIAYADAFNLQAAGRWAFEGKLEDISDVIT